LCSGCFTMRGLCPTRPSGRIPALRTPTAGPMIGAHPPILYPVETPHSGQPQETPTIGARPPIPRPAQPPHCGQPQEHQQWGRAHEYRVRLSLRIAGQPGRHHPAGHDLSRCCAVVSSNTVVSIE